MNDGWYLLCISFFIDVLSPSVILKPWKLPEYNLKLAPMYGGQEKLKEEADHFRLVGVRFKKQGTDIWGLSWAATRWVDLCSWSPNVKSLYRGLTWLLSQIPSRWFQHLITISSICPWGSFWEQRRQAEPTFQGRWRGWGVSNSSGPVHGSTGGHNLPEHIPGKLVKSLLRWEVTKT